MYAYVDADREMRAVGHSAIDDMRAAVQYAPSSAYWSERLKHHFGADARKGIDALEQRLRDAQGAQATQDAEEKKLRRMLCVAYSGTAAYMDDGEASDARAHPFIDFMRDSVDEIQAKMRERGVKAAPAAGARPSITPTERVTIHTLISLARLTYLALDDSEEFVDDDGRCHRISGQAFDDVEATLETLDELPDDKPGVTLSPGGKAWWALRGLLNPVAQAAPQQAAPASQDALVAALERAYFWMDSQADTQSKGGHATFDLMMLREERDAAKAAIDAARAKQEAK